MGKKKKAPAPKKEEKKKAAPKTPGDPLQQRREQLVSKLGQLLVEMRSVVEKYDEERETYYSQKAEEAKSKIKQVETKNFKERIQKLKARDEKKEEVPEEKEERIPFAGEIAHCEILIQYLERKQASKSTVMKHNWQTFAEFEGIGMTPPLAHDAVPQALKTIKQKLAAFKKKQTAKLNKTSKSEEKPTPDSKEEPKAVEKAEETKAEEKAEEKVEEPKAEEPKVEEKAEEPKAEETKVEEPKAEETKAEEPKVEEKAEEPKVEEAEEDDEVDLFGEQTEEEKARVAEMEEAQAKKPKKGDKAAKSSVVLDVKPEDSDTDMAALEASIRELKIDGLEWKAGELKPIAFGLKLLRISLVIEDDKVSMDDVQEEIEKLESVQSTDIFA